MSVKTSKEKENLGKVFWCVAFDFVSDGFYSCLLIAVGQYLSGIKLKAFDVRKLSQMSTDNIVQYKNFKSCDICDI